LEIRLCLIINELVDILIGIASEKSGTHILRPTSSSKDKCFFKIARGL